MKLYGCNGALRCKLRCDRGSRRIDVAEQFFKVHKKNRTDNHAANQKNAAGILPRTAPPADRNHQTQCKKNRIDHFTRWQKNGKNRHFDHIAETDRRFPETEIQNRCRSEKAHGKNKCIIGQRSGHFERHRKQCHGKKGFFRHRRPTNTQTSQNREQQKIHETSQEQESKNG